MIRLVACGLAAGLMITIASREAAAQKKDKGPDKGAPVVLYTVPLVLTPGTTQPVTLRGRNLDGVKEIRVGGAGAEARAKVLTGKKTPPGNNQPGEKLGDSELAIELTLPKAAGKGVTLTAVSPKGESSPHSPLLRDELPAVVEKEPNDSFDQAQVVPLPSAIEGVIRADRDVDVYRFEGMKGDRVAIEVAAARHGSPLDALVTLYDDGRRILASVDDVDGSPDPSLTAVLPRDGAYFVSVIDAHDLGGPQFGYRLVVKKVK